MQSPVTDRFRTRLLLYFVAFAVHGALLVWVAAKAIDVFRWSPDSWEYMASMIAIRDGDWGFYMLVARTPGYPLLLRAFSALFNLQPPQMTVWLVFQAAFISLIVVLGWHVVFRLTRSRTLAFVSALLLCFNPANLAGETPLLSEGLFNLSFIIAQLFLLRWLDRKHWSDFIICLVALQVMVLTRPTGEFLILVIIAVILAYNWRLWRYAVLLVAGFSIPIVVWTWHNNNYYQINSYTTLSAYNFLFYKAISTESMVTGRSPDDIAWDYSRIIEDRIGNPPREHITFPVGNYDYLYSSDANRYKAMAQLATEKLLQFNVLHLVKAPYLMFKQLLEYDTLAPFVPGPLRPVISVVSLIFATFGVWRWIRQKRPFWQHILALGIVAYFTGSVAVYAPIANIRYTSPFGIYWTLFIVLGVYQIRQLLNRSPRVAPLTNTVASSQ